MVVALDAFNDLVKLYESNILREGRMDKDDVFDEDYGQSSSFDLTVEDKNTFTTAYEERIGDFQSLITEHHQLLAQRQGLAVDKTANESDELDVAIYQSEENIEGLIHELVSYRDVVGYDAVLEQKAFGSNTDLFTNHSPPSFEQIAAFVFAELDRPKKTIDINEQWESEYPDKDSVVQVSSFEAIALTMFDALDGSGDYANDTYDINEQWESPVSEISISPDNLEERRDLQLARDCREILQSQGQDMGRAVVFERPDGNGIYRFSLEKDSDTMTLVARDRAVNPILVESQGKIINSQVTSHDAAQIGKAASILNEQSKSNPITR
ncbi:MAG: hypothetical protein IM535_12070 [Pseudanabaena sp. M38BS1SP1A06MG]|nr:hypothetical protein [Pseudanabaena sp. M53BS1SP1A06MG]MCA6592816.1 hypothetical protein [Pseudanabaena sp. M38BS1SP1A06MG]